jgi:hypothetical protein
VNNVLSCGVGAARYCAWDLCKLWIEFEAKLAQFLLDRRGGLAMMVNEVRGTSVRERSFRRSSVGAAGVSSGRC